MKGFSIVSVNVRSLYPKLDEVYIRFNEFDLICLCETWTNSSYTDEMLAINGYKLFRLDRDQCKDMEQAKKRGGGIAIYIKNELSEYCSIQTEVSSVTVNLEQLFVVIDKPEVRKQIIGEIYRPPGGKIAESIKELDDSATILRNKIDGEMTILGDLNINYNLRHSSTFKLLKSFERDHNLSQIINTSTRVTKKSSTCIDLVFTNMEYILHSGTIDLQISDLLPIFLIKKKEKTKCTFHSSMVGVINHMKKKISKTV